MAIKDTQNIIGENDTATRPPVVVILGHVDHGKSSLLEAIKEEFRITAKESGGITQHIGAYMAQYQGKAITFLDTPGHEAFSAMRSRGAKAADIAVLVVAADDGVQVQTKEALHQAQDAKIPIIVAINKIDKSGVQPEKIKQQLSQEGVYVESFGGQVPCVLTSATTKQGIAELLDMILLVAEVEDLKTNGAKPAEGVVVESSLDPQRGPATTLLVLEGSLKQGDIVATQSSWGKVKIMEDFQGQPMDIASPSMPCLIIGFEGMPGVGEKFLVFQTEELAKGNIVKEEKEAFIFQEIKEGVPTFDIILKADVVGSLEVVKEMLSQIPQENVTLRFVAEGVGEIGESDVKTAIGTKATIIGFRAKAAGVVLDLATREGVAVETFDVVYDLVQRVRLLMEKAIGSKTVRSESGSMKVLAVFLDDRKRQIIGGRIGSGEIQKGGKVEIVRNEDVVGTGRIVNLQKQKKDALSVSSGEECGILYEGSEKVQIGDVLKAFVVETQQGVL